MAITIDRTAADVQLAGHSNYAQVEPNHLSAPRSGGVYAQLPAADSIEVLEQGTFVKYDYANGEVNFTGEGPWMMVFNEEKLYDEHKQMHRDFAMLKADAIDGKITPRVFRMYAGDVFTTNAVAAGSYEVADKLAPGADGILAAAGDSATGLVCQVVKTYTLADGQPAVKVQVISE
jgi:hypothetical protein